MSDVDTLWNNAVKGMISAIKSDNNMRDYFMDFIPNESTGYAWTQDPQYKKYSAILELKTKLVYVLAAAAGGASFACCIREAVDHIRKEIVIAEESTIITLETIN